VADAEALGQAVTGCDAVFHLAGAYRIGIPARERPAMYAANVAGTERVLDAAANAGVSRIVYVSTVTVFGNTRGEVVDETYRRPAGDYLSYYDETKCLAHQAAMDRAGKGAPLVIAQPGGVYGPGDHSEIGTLMDQMRTGTLRFLSFPETGFNAVFVDDVADGILLTHDRGRVGECYVLGGEITTLGKIIRRVAELSGRRPPGFTMPAWLSRSAIPLGPLVGRILHQPPNLRELIRAADGVTYWATDRKARQELGYAPRDLDTGLRQTLSAA
jgi:nucleoside-diphosphate-sugar epimerase